ncbi:MAG: HAMP domain-containing histidine kinase [Clostridia bacterium]|nr:HAMP domain-containing histidine kinase [Clostridia bacterium]
MFKSIFGKYLVTFTVILLICIAAILFAVASAVSGSVRADRVAVMQTAADKVVALIEIEVYNGRDLASAVKSGEVAENAANAFDEAGATLYVFDSAGNCLLPEGAGNIPQSAVSSIFGSGKTYAVSTIEGYFEHSRINVCRASQGDGTDFCVILSSDKTAGDKLTRKLVGVSVGVSLWVFLAAMVSLYAISLHTTKPLNEIVSAAKSYAKGRFDRKIEVAGHDEVAELAAAINEMASSLAHLEETRNAFIGNVSHDLRTPMTTIAGFVEGIRDGTIPPEKQDYYLEIISQEVRRLSRLVNSLLEISRIESNTELKLSDFNLTEKGRTVLISLENKINAKNLEIEFDCGEEDVFVNADPDSIHRVIYNLLDNAVKFTPESGKISIKITAVSDGRRRRKALFSVRNTGEGIPVSELPHVFDKFYKTDLSRSLDKSGVGLGLFIAKNAIRRHGEDLVAESEEGKYTEFRFTLPLAEKQK